MNLHKKTHFKVKKDGFTLIELLVVVAIIALLAALILVALTSSRLKAKDSKIQTALYQIRNAAELRYTASNNYDAVCNDSDNTLNEDDPDFKRIEDAVRELNGNQDVKCFEGAGKKDYAAASPMVSKPGKFWCVSSVGVSLELDCQITTSSCACI